MHTIGNNKTGKQKIAYLKLSGSQVCNRIYQFVSLKKKKKKAIQMALDAREAEEGKLG